jgi:hypothetical protein
MSDFTTVVFQRFGLQKVIDEFEPFAGDIIEDLMGIYDGFYGEGSSNYTFVLSALRTLILEHRQMTAVRGNNEIPDAIKTAVVDIVTARVYERGSTSLRENGRGTPS